MMAGIKLESVTDMHSVRLGAKNCSKQSRSRLKSRNGSLETFSGPRASLSDRSESRASGSGVVSECVALQSTSDAVESRNAMDACQSLAYSCLLGCALSLTLAGSSSAAESMDFGGMNNMTDLRAKLEAQIKLDLQADLEVQLSSVPKEAPSLLELAEHFEEIDSKMPSDSTMAGLVSGNQAPMIGNPEIVATSFAGGLALSSAGSAASAVGTAAMEIVAPAVSVAVPAAVNLSAKIAAIVAEGVQHFAGGGLAGAIGAGVVYPLDTVKTKMQAQRKGKEGDDEQYENEIDCILKLVKKDGIGALYSGIGPQLIGIAPEKAMKLTVNEILLSILEVFLPGTRIWMLEIIAGGGGGFSQILFTNPVETLKLKLQTQKQKKSIPEIIKEIGVKGLFHGSVATMAREIPGSAVFFACYTLMKELYPEQYFLDGCMAAIPAAFIVTPADVIKTKLTIGAAPGEEPYSGAFDCMKRVVAKEGFGGLYNGWATRILRIGPQFGITLMVYDMLYHHK